MRLLCLLLFLLVFSVDGMSDAGAEQQVASSSLGNDMELRVERQLKENMGDKMPEDVEVNVELQVDKDEESELEVTTNRREDFYQEVEYMLSEYDQELALMRTKIVKLGAKASKESKEDVDKLQSLRLSAGDELTRLKGAEGAAWDELKIQMEATMEHLDRVYEKAISYFQDEPEAGEAAE